MNLDIRLMPEDFNAWQARAVRRHPDVTVSHYLSFQALRVTADYRMTEDNIFGVQWRGTPNSIQGNREGIRVPTLLLSATCAPHRVPSRSPMITPPPKTKKLVGVEGANHGFTACRPEFGDTLRRAIDYVDGWLSKSGRF